MIPSKNYHTSEYMNGRKREIDILKGIGIILMIIGHIEFGEIIDKGIHGFHMVLFIWVSGFLHKSVNSNFKGWLLKKIRSLLVPYFFFGMCFIFIAGLQVVAHQKNIQDFTNHIIHLLFVNTEGLAVAGAIWYLTAIFFIEIIYVIVENNIKSDFVKMIMVCAIFAMGILIATFNIKLPWGVGIAFVGVLFYHIGVCTKKYETKLQELNRGYGIVFLIVGMLIIMLNSNVNMRLEKYGNPVMFVLGAIFTTIGLLKISYRISLSKNILITELNYIGRNSLVYLCLNEFFLFFLKKFLQYSNILWLDVLSRITVLLITLILLHIATIVFDLYPLRIFIGKKRK